LLVFRFVKSTVHIVYIPAAVLQSVVQDEEIVPLLLAVIVDVATPLTNRETGPLGVYLEPVRVKVPFWGFMLDAPPSTSKLGQAVLAVTIALTLLLFLPVPLSLI
jgi:hypothetical protein